MSTARKSWRDVLPVHPAADLFPMMSADELKALGQDIKKHGLKSPIALWLSGDNDEVFLLDGRNRMDAMEAVGIRTLDERGGLPPFILRPSLIEKRTTDPYEYVISANIHRRHLTADQKRDLIGKLLKATPEKSNRQIAKQVKADDKTVASIRRDLEATAEIPQLEKTTGADGKARKQPAKRAAKASGATLYIETPGPCSRRRRVTFVPDDAPVAAKSAAIATAMPGDIGPMLPPPLPVGERMQRMLVEIDDLLALAESNPEKFGDLCNFGMKLGLKAALFIELGERRGGR
jgi:hypothetical protein